MPIADPTSMPFTDLSDPIMFSDPFPRYAELRRTSPVSRVRHREMRRIDAYMLTRYDDVLALHTDARFSSCAASHGAGGVRMRFLPKTFRLLTDSMVYKDDPEHKRLRSLVNNAFTPKRVQQMSGDVQRIVGNLVDRIASTGTTDLVADLAVPLPLSVIATMLGVDDRHRDQFKSAVELMAEASTSGSTRDLTKVLSNGRRVRLMLDRLARQRRSTPDEGLISALVRANDDGDVLDDDEVVSMAFLLLFAGHDTTSNLIGSAMLTLLDHTEQLERLRAEPDLIDSAVEELLRFTTPVPCGTTRTTVDDVDIAGVTIPKHSSVLGMIISANRDESVFDRAEELDLGRSPNRHLAFAFGSHFCLGNQLARMEARVALSALVQRFDRIELAVPREQLSWKSTESLRGLRSLPLQVS